MSEAYRAAGVSLQAADEVVERFKPLAQKTLRPEVLAGLGGFGGLFQLDLSRFPNPVLVSGTDGVGTKLKLAFELNRHDTIGLDLVAMCVNDILVQGAEPLFFLDYLACGELRPDQAEAIVGGVSRGCEESGCALLGGETAEMPGMYASGEYDLAGFAVGAVSRENLIDGSRIAPGDVVIGLTSSGVHSNGFSLVRKILADRQLSLNIRLPGSSLSLGEVLLEPTRLYVKPILAVMKTCEIRGMAHITGGGLSGNVPRMLPPGVSVELEHGCWPVPAIFQFLQDQGELSFEDLEPVFNLGIGFVLCVPQAQADSAMRQLADLGQTPYRIGRVVSGNGVVVWR